jgi:hypothetical protein
VIRRQSAGTFGQLLKLDSEDMVHAKVVCDFRCDLTPSGAAGMAVRFLQTDKVGIRAGKESGDLIEVGAARYVPADHADLVHAPEHEFCPGERPGFDEI